jgi:NAD(P)-dependent dehydrogenase (short-subunit alcohol dehydrogenase family)
MYPVYKFIGQETKCKEVPIAFPAQHQDRQPGLEYLMVPPPISENPYDTGSGKLKGKAAIITGGDSGIGRAVAYLFAREGADIAVAYLDEHKDAEETKRRIEQLGGRCLLVPGDLKQESTAREVVARTMDTFGRLDILVNNCAIQIVQRSLADITAEQLDLTFRTNIFSYFYMAKAALPHLKNGGAIINTASVTAYAGRAELLDYSSAKGAIVSFTRSLALSLAEKGIRVNAVAPGPVWTPLTVSSWSEQEVQTFGTYPSSPPMGRAAQPFEIAASYLFLASDDSSYMTGQVLHPNGGTMTET